MRKFVFGFGAIVLVAGLAWHLADNGPLSHFGLHPYWHDAAASETVIRTWLSENEIDAAQIQRLEDMGFQCRPRRDVSGVTTCQYTKVMQFVGGRRHRIDFGSDGKIAFVSVGNTGP